MFQAISSENLETITGGALRAPQTACNGGICGGHRQARAPQVDVNGAIVGGQRVDIPVVVRQPQVAFNGAIVGGARWPR
jgi:hypothetical protein